MRPNSKRDYAPGAAWTNIVTGRNVVVEGINAARMVSHHDAETKQAGRPMLSAAFRALHTKRETT